MRILLIEIHARRAEADGQNGAAHAGVLPAGGADCRVLPAGGADCRALGALVDQRIVHGRHTVVPAPPRLVLVRARGN